MTPVMTPVPARTFGNVGTGGSCTGDNECLQNHICISKNGGICATMGTCYNDNDCDNPNNLGWSAAGCAGKAKCTGVTCERDCKKADSSSASNSVTNYDVPNPGTGTYNANRPALKGQALTCPSKEAMLQDNSNCCQYIADDKIETSCLYPASGTQCDCAGQNNDAGVSYCATFGWNCRTVMSSF